MPAEKSLLVSAIFEIPAPGLGIPALLKPRKYLGIFQFHERRDRFDLTFVVFGRKLFNLTIFFKIVKTSSQRNLHKL